MSRSAFENACTQFCDHQYMGNQGVLCRVLTRYKMYVDVNDHCITPHLMMDGYWESWITLFLSRIVQPGMTCLDVGANLGYYSLLMGGLAGDTGKTLSFEPNPGIFRYLRATQTVNGNLFEAFQLALSGKTGEAVLTFNENEPGGATIKPNELTAGKHQVTVPVYSLDDIVKEKGLRKVDVIKLDVEGVEPQVFEGMEKTMAANPQLRIVMEYSPVIYEDALGFTNYLFNRFHVHRIKHSGEALRLKSSAIEELLNTPDHSDLYLEVK